MVQNVFRFTPVNKISHTVLETKKLTFPSIVSRGDGILLCTGSGIKSAYRVSKGGVHKTEKILLDSKKTYCFTLTN